MRRYLQLALGLSLVFGALLRDSKVLADASCQAETLAESYALGELLSLNFRCEQAPGKAQLPPSDALAWRPATVSQDLLTLHFVALAPGTITLPPVALAAGQSTPALTLQVHNPLSDKDAEARPAEGPLALLAFAWRKLAGLLLGLLVLGAAVLWWRWMRKARPDEAPYLHPADLALRAIREAEGAEDGRPDTATLNRIAEQLREAVALRIQQTLSHQSLNELRELARTHTDGTLHALVAWLAEGEALRFAPPGHNEAARAHWLTQAKRLAIRLTPDGHEPAPQAREETGT